MFKTSAAFAATAVAISLSSRASADISSLLDAAHQIGGNQGLIFRPVDENGDPAFFTLTARSSIDDAQPFNPIAGSLPGTIFVDPDGTGVQTSTGSGSKGISGTGAHDNEQLVFTFDAPVSAAAIRLGLADIKFGSGAGHDDDPVLFFSAAGSGSFGITIQEAAIQSAFTSTGSERGVVNFAQLAGLPTGLIIDSFAVRETHDHIFVNSITNPVPGPGSVALLGLAALCAIRRRCTTA